MSQIKVHVQKEGTVLKGHTPRTCKKAALNSRYKSTHAHNSHCRQCTAQQAATTTVRQRTPATASPYLKRVGGEPHEHGLVGITSPLPARAAGTPTSRSKTTLQSSKAGNAYHRVLQSSGNRVNALTTTRVRPKTTSAEPVDKPSAHTRQDKEAHGKPERPRETRVSRHKHPTSQTFTRSGRNNQVLPRETPNNHVRSNVSPQARPPQTSTRSRVHK
ncbi:hypothetical protein Taro_039631 [Colocasia esculenta]|uniref:Uncharacterized protein n=1 Tax=Colocasia esculenta TaxID=4460 RepID=A0A843W6X1_COLES|nr:hypothetical protein [Colocasia esculenta]